MSYRKAAGTVTACGDGPREFEQLGGQLDPLATPPRSKIQYARAECASEGQVAARDIVVPPAVAARDTAYAGRQLEIFAIRCLELADLVAENQIGFIDAVDLAYDAAIWSGLVETVGDDVTQATMAAAFANARSPV